MIKNKIKYLGLLGIIGLIFTNTNASANDEYTEFNYEEELSSKISNVLKDVKQLHLKNRESYIKKENKIVREIEEKQRVKFILKDYKKIDIYVRENYTIINNDYVSKNPSGWKRVLIKQTNIWE